MARGERLALSAGLASLYLRGRPTPTKLRRAHWLKAARALLRDAPDLGGLAGCLRRAGLWCEASILESPGVIDWGVKACLGGNVLTAVDPEYPARWTQVLGQSAPPCLWVDGVLPGGLFVGAVGSREPSADEAALADLVGRGAMSSGMSLVSGGAVGCDQIAAQAALLTGPGARVVEILPFGLECPGGGADARPGITRVSVCEPGARFATGQAMERNLLIYALSSATGVVGPRLRRGGTWSGAAEALRRRVGPVLVAGDDAPAVSALRAMGALDLVSFVDVAAALERDDLCGEPSLFRPVDALLERRAGYLVA